MAIVLSKGVHVKHPNSLCKTGGEGNAAAFFTPWL